MLKHAEILNLIESMTQSLRKIDHINSSLLIGIHTGGAHIAERIHKNLNNPYPLGLLDISFYRDDFTRIGLNPKVKSSDLPNSIEGKHLILIDDVLHTGRTIRAAMNELFDYGRPQSISLAVLLNRKGRELPIEAQVCGMNIDLSPNQQIKLNAQDNQLSLRVIESSA